MKCDGKNPFDDASIWSRFFYLYAFPLLRIGARRPLVERDLPGLAKRDEVPTIAGRIESTWRSRKNKEGTRALAWSLLHTFKKELLISGWYFAVDFWAIIAQAALLRPTVNWLSTDKARVGEGVMWALLLVATGVINIVYHHYAFFMLMRCGWNLRAGMTRVLHEKLLRVRASDVAARLTSGKMYSLVAADAQRFDNLMPFFHAPWFAAVAVVTVYALLVPIVGYAAAAAGCGVVSASVGVQIKLAFDFRRLRAQTAERTDARVRLVDEMCAAILTVKASGWTVGFLDRVDALRAAETATILRSQYCKAITSGLYICTVVVATFAVYVVLYVGDGSALPENGLSTGDVASIVGLLNALRQIVSFGCAYFFLAFPEVLVALDRMQHFLLLPELVVESKRVKNSDEDVLLRCADLTLAWPVASEKNAVEKMAEESLESGERTTRSWAVSGISLDVRVGQVVAVAGPVASGKSSFLQGASLRELDVSGGSVERSSTTSVAYAAQQPWLFAGTLRQNVAAPDSASFDEVLFYCDLQLDVESLPGQKDARLGDRGITLSGGQRARVSLARAVAAALATERRVLVVLDDPTAALDAKVANTVVERCFKALLSTGRVAILVATHARPLLRRADMIVVLNADGRFAAKGTLDELVASGDQSADLLLLEGEDEESEADVVEEESRPERDVEVKDDSSAAVVEDSKEDAKPTLLLLEERETGTVALKTWIAYAKGAGLWTVFAVLTLFVIGQGLLVVSDAYLLTWSTASRRSQRRPSRLLTFALLAAATVLVCLFRAACFYAVAIRAATSLHRDALAGVMRGAPLWWHAGTPRGRIVNRFSSDVGNIDELLAQALFDLAQLGLLMVTIFVAACVAVPFLSIIVPIFGIIFIRFKNWTTKSMTELKRMDQIFRSPAVSRFADTLHGHVSIRAFDGMAQIARVDLDAALDTSGRAWFWWLLTQRILGFYLDALCLLFLACLITSAIVLKLVASNLIKPELVALGLLYTVQLSSNFQWAVRQFALSESFMASVERLIHYGRDLPVEEEEDEKSEKLLAAPSSEWPRSARVELVDLRVRYRQDLPDVLRGISASFPSGSTVGVAGRSGSGKSSLALALARLNVISGGSVVLDGIDISTLPLDRLRDVVSIIPQDPHLFAGNVRDNVDPLRQMSDEEVEGAMIDVGFPPDEQGRLLDRKVTERAGNLSTGERQLVCLCRALLSRRRVITLDEATAGVDVALDTKIQNLLRNKSSLGRSRESTVFVIAHRIWTIKDADLILVLESGGVVELAPPDTLLADPRSAFRQMHDAALAESQGAHGSLQDGQRLGSKNILTSGLDEM